MQMAAEGVDSLELSYGELRDDVGIRWAMRR